MNAPADRPERRWWAHTLPWIVLASGVALSFLLATALGDRIRKVSGERFGALVTQQELQLSNRFNAYVQILRGAQGLWRSGAVVDRAAWRRYVEALALQQNSPGIQGVGYATVVAPEERERFERSVRAEGPAQPPALQALFAGFAIHPPGPRPLYTPIVYLEPFADRNLRPFGYDMFSEPVRRAAMERARDSGEPALSGRVRLLQETETDVQPGFLVYLPVYRGEPQTVEERRQQLAGFVFSPFRAVDFMRNALASKGLYAQYTIYDGATATPDYELFRSDQPEAAPAGYASVVHSIALAGHQWTVVSWPGPLLISGADRTVALLVAGAGTLISILLYGLTLAWARTREAAEQMAHRMTADLRRRELEVEHMSAELRQSNEDLQQFAYAASHDLKEPLRSIASSLGLLARRVGLDANAREFLGYANDGAQRLSGLIDNLLDYSRVHTQAGPPQPVELEEALDTALRDLGSLIADSGVQITREPLPRVMGDRAQVIRVLQNLLDNAIKYSRKHAAVPRVSVTARHEGTFCVIGVTDNGIGIAPEHHDKVFVMFKRLHTRQEYEGNGMGLALCKVIIQRLGGRIWLRSKPGEGSSFFFTLPAAPAAALPAEPARRPQTEPANPS